MRTGESGGISQEHCSGNWPVFRERVVNWSENEFEIFNYQPDKYRNEDLTGVSIKGVLTLEIRRAFILKTVPLKPEQTVDMPRRHYTIKNVDYTPDSIEFKLTANSAASTLRGDFPGSGDWENLTWLVFNRAKGEWLGPEKCRAAPGAARCFCSIPWPRT